MSYYQSDKPKKVIPLRSSESLGKIRLVMKERSREKNPRVVSHANILSSESMNQLAPLLKNKRSNSVLKKSISIAQKTINSLDISIENELSKNLEEFSLKEPISKEKLKIYQVSFEQVISKSMAYSSLLSRIKQAYDQYILRMEQENSSLLSENETLTKSLNEEKTMVGQINRRFKALAAENIELNSTINEMRMTIEDLQDMDYAHCDKIYKKSKDLELKMKIKLQETAKKYQKLKLSHKKINKAVALLRQKGFPVDDVIMNEVNPQNIEQLWLEVPSYHETSICSESSDTHHQVSHNEEKSLDFSGISPIIKKDSP